MKNGGGRFHMECYILSAKILKICCLMGRHPYERRFAMPFNGSVILFGAINGRVSPYFCERPVQTPSIRYESVTRNIPRLCIIRGENLERRHLVRRHIEELEQMDASEIYRKEV